MTVHIKICNKIILNQRDRPENEGGFFRKRQFLKSQEVRRLDDRYGEELLPAFYINRRFEFLC
jgi:hypothetical protein